ncbi:hypothetical protein [Nonomuraea sp. NPDC049480]|uniref:hypothetical protein n=1 Tax=Nonomuraea sp. NPDC049480 TaxID=3364353 RepID=UPI0037BACB95
MDGLLAADGPENVRALQRALRDIMTEHAGVVHDESGLLKGLAELTAVEARIDDVGVHPDLAGFQVWSGSGSVEGEAIPPIPAEIAALMREVSTAGKLAE